MLPQNAGQGMMAVHRSRRKGLKLGPFGGRGRNGSYILNEAVGSRAATTR